MSRPAVLAAVFALLATPVDAASTPWSEIGPGSRLRLISDDTRAPDGTTRLGIEIELAPATKTYWRVPGETGLPLQLDLAGPGGDVSATIAWPYPLREVKDGYLEYVYYGAVLLPVTIPAPADVETMDIQAAVTLGVCSDICIPARSEFELQIDLARPDRSSAFRLDVAGTRVPVPDMRDPAYFGAVSLAAGGALVALSEAPASVNASLIVVADDPRWLFGAPQNGPHSGLIEIPVVAGGDVSALVGSTLRLTYVTDQGPFELQRRVGQQALVDPASDLE